MAVGVINIEVGGVKRPFRFKYLAIKGLAADLNADSLEEIPAKLQNVSLEMIESILYHGFRAGAEYQKMPLDFKREDIEAWLDEDMQFFKPAIEEAKVQLLAAIQGPKSGTVKGSAAAKKP
tara:strand:+ start:6997 stop:7359 length:363 start_codon:yes stop_codon:yes gene_type:complete